MPAFTTTNVDGPAGVRIPCLHCAELIVAAATTCRFCGAAGHYDLRIEMIRPKRREAGGRGLRRSCLVALAALAALTGCVAASGAEVRVATGVDPARLVLRQSDLPRGYLSLYTHHVSNEQSDRDNGPDPHCTGRFALSAEIGRIDGYIAAFARRGAAMSLVESHSTIHKSRRGAARLVATFARVTGTCRGIDIHRTALGARLGEQAELWRGTITESRRTSPLAVLVWRWHERVGLLVALGPAAAERTLIVRLAQKQEARIEAAR